MSSTISATPTQQNDLPKPMSETELRQALKQKVSALCNQIFNGCHRSCCYNVYCSKNKTSLQNYKDKPKQKIVVEVLKLISPGAKYEYEQLSCICKGKVVDVENKFNNFLLDSNYDFSNEIMNSAYPQVNLDLHKVNDYFTKEQDKLSIETDIKDFNEVYSVFEMLLGFKDLSEEARMSLLYNTSNTSRLTNIIYYTYYLMTQFYLYLLIHPGFSLSQPLTEDLLLFFRNYVDIKRLMKIAVVIVIKSTDTINNINDSDLKQQRRSAFKRAFASITKYAELFKQMVSNSQTFLSLLLFNIDSKRGDETDEEHLNMYDERLITLLEQFTRSFSTLYKINCDYSLLPYKEFYNDSLSKYLNIKYQCRIYNEILKKNYTGRKPFTLLSYIWLFDAAAKSDIFTEFNSNQQASEMLHVIRDMHNPLVLINAMDMQSMFLYIQVKRDKIIEDTLNYISNSSLNLKKQLKIKFIGEQGVDEGGVRKEFFMLLVRQIFDANYGMFSYNEKTRYFWFNLYSFEPKIKYELIGVLLGLAWFNSIILDVKFPLVIYKKLLGIPTTLDDLKDCEPELYQTFTYLLNTNDDNLKETLCMNFTVTVDKFGENVVIPLKEGGENIYIDQSNKHEYISLYLDWYFNKSIESYFVCFKNGFYRVCDSKLAHLLRAEELELIICGTQYLDFHELEKSAKYEDGYEKDSLTCKQFWEVLHELNEEEKKKFLFFVTGCDRAPINGLGSLVIVISRFGPDSQKLPCAHTCFNHLLLPDYQNKDKLKRLLHIAINNSEGFGLI